MKKINSIGYGHKIWGLAMLFLTVIPFCCYFFDRILQTAFFSALMYTSVGAGFLILVFLAGLLAVEFYQDKKIHRRYATGRKKKLALESGRYECQSCGSRQVTGSEKSCGICGTRFKTERGDRG